MRQSSDKAIAYPCQSKLDWHIIDVPKRWFRSATGLQQGCLELCVRARTFSAVRHSSVFACKEGKILLSNAGAH